jgi:urea transporter
VGALTRAFDALASVFAQAVFSRHRAVGVLIMLAIATRPTCLVLGLCALAGAELSVLGLRLVRGYVPFGYNALLCGVLLGHDYGLSVTSLGFACALGGVSALTTAMLSSLSAQLGYLPVLAIPATLTSWFGFGFAPHLGLVGRVPEVDGCARALPTFIGMLLQGLGAFVWVPSVPAGLLVGAALLLHSRISALIGFAALALSAFTVEWARAPLSDAVWHTLASNAGLAAIAIGAVWLVPSRRAYGVAIAGALLAAFFVLGSAIPLARLGLSAGFLPFGVVVIAVVSALRQRESYGGPAPAPVLAQSAADGPEQLLLDELARVRVPALQIHPPFLGRWTCTQGAHGPFTHRGAFAHAYDFEIYSEEDGALCRGHGLTVDDYYCFAQPVLAAADGIVVAIENSVANNRVGDSDPQRPWGNYVLLHHGYGGSVYSVVAHLTPGSVTVYPGQAVARGTVIGYCGNSGVSPRPHLHFQLQAAPYLGSPTLPCELSDVLVRSGEPLCFEPLHEAQHGESIQALTPDYALAAYFDVPLGATITYSMDGELERVVCEIDRSGRAWLRSLDRRSQLQLLRSYSCLRTGELHGSPRSVLRLLRLALACVPFERQPGLTFRSVLPARFLGGALRQLRWDVGAVLGSPATIEVRASIEIDDDGLAIVGASRESDSAGTPRLRTRARFGRGPGPMSIEVISDGRTQRAELVTKASGRGELLAQDAIHHGQAAAGLPLRIRDSS